MSLSFEPVKTVKVVDPRLDYAKHSFVAVEGSQQSSWYGVQPQTTSANSLIYTITPPSKQIVIDRKVVHRTTINLKISGYAQVGQPLLAVGSYDAPRSFGFHRLCNNIAVNVNNNQFSVQSHNVFPVLAHMHSEELDHHCDGVPHVLDRSQSYDTFTGTNRNVLGGLGAQLETDARGAFPMTITSNPVGAGAVVTVDRFGTVNGTGGGAYAVGSTLVTAVVSWEEYSPIFASPWLYNEDAMGLTGIDRLTFSFTFDSRLQSLWSHASIGGSAISSITPGDTGLFTNSTLWVNTLTPKLLQDSVPRDIVLPYSEFVTYSQPQATMNPGDTRDLISNSVQLRGIPDKVLIYARNPLGSQWVDDTDGWLTISKVAITLGNETSLLATATPFHLYQMSKGNGLSVPWVDFVGYASAIGGARVATLGSPVVLQFGRDIPLKDGQSSGSAGNINFQCTVTCTHGGPRAITPELVYIPVYSGTVTIDNGSVIPQTSVLTTSDVLNAPSAPYGSLFRAEGGSFFNTLKSGWQAALPLMKMGKSALEGADKMGLLGRGQSGGAVPSGLVFGLGQSGAGMSGGAKLTKARLRAQILAQHE